MTKTNSVKTWIASHKEEIIAGTVVTALTAGFIALVVVAVKAENEEIEAMNKRAKERNDWFQNEFNSNKDVYYLADGRFLSVPTSARDDISVM